MSNPSHTPPLSVLVTGAARRVGRHIACHLAKKGWRIVLHYHGSQTEAEETAHTLASQGGHVDILKADLMDHDAVLSLIPRARALLDTPLTGLINNASLFEEDHLDNLTLEGWDRHIHVNLRAPVFLTQAFARALQKDREALSSPLRGSLIHLLDQRVEKLTPQFFSYTLSKTALGTATKTMAQALAPHIRVNAVAPGPTLANARQSKEDFEKQCQATPLKTGSPPRAIAEAVAYLMGAEAVTGQILFVDGGQRLIWKSPDTRDLQE